MEKIPVKDLIQFLHHLTLDITAIFAVTHLCCDQTWRKQQGKPLWVDFDEYLWMCNCVASDLCNHSTGWKNWWDPRLRDLSPSHTPQSSHLSLPGHTTTAKTENNFVYGYTIIYSTSSHRWFHLPSWHSGPCWSPQTVSLPPHVFLYCGCSLLCFHCYGPLWHFCLWHFWSRSVLFFFFSVDLKWTLWTLFLILFWSKCIYYFYAPTTFFCLFSFPDSSSYCWMAPLEFSPSRDVLLYSDNYQWKW